MLNIDLGLPLRGEFLYLVRIIITTVADYGVGEIVCCLQARLKDGLVKSIQEPIENVTQTRQSMETSTI